MYYNYNFSKYHNHIIILLILIIYPSIDKVHEEYRATNHSYLHITKRKEKKYWDCFCSSCYQKTSLNPYDKDGSKILVVSFPIHNILIFY